MEIRTGCTCLVLIFTAAIVLAGALVLSSKYGSSRLFEIREGYPLQIAGRPPPDRRHHAEILAKPPQIPSTTPQAPRSGTRLTELMPGHLLHEAGLAWGALDAPVSRTVLLLGVPSVASSLHGQESQFEVVYADTREEVLQAAFAQGAIGLVLDYRRQLPFADLSFDIVVVGKAWCSHGCGNITKFVVDDWMRLLRPLGKLVFWQDFDHAILDEQPLALATESPNMFVRADKHADTKTLPICPQCWRTKDRYMPYGEVLGEGLLSTRCQAYISPEYKSVDLPERRDKLMLESSKKGLSTARLKWAHIPNVWSTNYNGQKWFHTETERGTKPTGSEANNYAGLKQKDGSWRVKRKIEWSDGLSHLIRTGSVKRMIDAGAGTCSLAAHLRSTGEAELLTNYAQFGGYSCNMLRQCAERGSAMFQWDWMVPLPLCTTCQFDLLTHFEGLHHIVLQKAKHVHAAGGELSGTRQNVRRQQKDGGVDYLRRSWKIVLDNFDRVLRCDGRMVLDDGPHKCDQFYSKLWAASKGYTQSKSGRTVTIEKRCGERRRNRRLLWRIDFKIAHRRLIQCESHLGTGSETSVKP